MHQETFHPNAESTPFSVKCLLYATLICSIFWALCTRFFPHFSYHYLLQVLTLTPNAVFRGYIWQLIFYPFVQPIFGKASFSYLIDLVFKLYMTWIVGSALVESKGEKSFLTLFFSGTIVCGACSAIFLRAFGTTQMFMGAHSCTYILLLSWMLLNPYAKLYLFFTIPLNISLVILGFWASNLFFSLMEPNIPVFLSYLVAGLYGYLYSVCVYKIFSPFLYLRSFESKLQDFFYKKRQKQDRGIYDFKTGKKLSKDEAFMDAMLAKIAKSGRDSLTKKELDRMDAIAKKSSS